MKTLKKFAELHNFRVDMQRKACYGKYNGYDIIIMNLQNQKNYMIQLSVCHEDANATQEAKNYTFSLASQYEGVHYANYASPNLTISVKRNSKSGPNLDLLVDVITRYLGQHQFQNCCQTCQQTSQTGFYSVQGKPYILCPDCFNKVSSSMMYRHSEAPKENVALGILGAILGSLVGVILWMILYRIGIIAAICGSVMVYCSLKCYEKLGHVLTKKGLIISTLICVLMIFLAEYASLSIEIYIQLKDIYVMNFFEALQVTPSFLGDSNVLPYFIRDLVIGYIFLIATSASSIRNISHQLNTQDEISRLY